VRPALQPARFSPAGDPRVAGFRQFQFCARCAAADLTAAKHPGVVPVTSQFMPTDNQRAAATEFPADFIWGAATAAYQIEGAGREHGKSESIWDRFAHTPGKVRGNDHGDIACDSYHRYPEDVTLLKDMGLSSYRYSLSWPRVLPDGGNVVNSRGLDYYRRLTDAVLAAGLRPLVTLYHWDLPQALEDRGGWANRDTALRFADYAAVVADALGDRVQQWLVLNEPKTFTSTGYWQGVHAPGRSEPLAFLKATHSANLAQGLGFAAIRASGAQAQIGSAFDVAPMYPHSNSLADIAAAERWHRFLNLWFVFPALHGRYPDGVLPPERQQELLGWQPGDEHLLRAPLDFIGLNYYSPWVVRDAPQGCDIPGLNCIGTWARGRGALPQTDIGWDIDAEGFRTILKRMALETGHRPIEITECGAAFNTGPGDNGEIDDHQRIDFVRQHLRALAGAIADGVPVRAFHYWSLLDNFEWAEGYSQRFGLVHVDFDHGQRRRLKASGHWYAQVAAANRVV
jgi:beta-glucosidase